MLICIQWESGNLTDFISACITLLGVIVAIITILQIKKQYRQIERQIETANKANDIAVQTSVDERIKEYTIYLLQEGRSVSKKINDIHLVSIINGQDDADKKVGALSEVLTNIVLYKQLASSIKDHCQVLNTEQIADSFKAFIEPMLLELLKNCDEIQYTPTPSSAAMEEIRQILSYQLQDSKIFLKLEREAGKEPKNIQITFS